MHTLLIIVETDVNSLLLDGKKEFNGESDVKDGVWIL